MPPASPARNDRLTVMVFKDNFASRTFEIPLPWITRLGLTLGLILALLAAASLTAARYYLAFRKTAPERVMDLENEISNLRGKVAAATSTSAENPAASMVITPLPDHTIAASAVSSPANVFFTAFPAHVRFSPPAASEIPIAISNLSTDWRSKTLNVGFDIHYSRQDGGNQQGRIIVTARGKTYFSAYPSGVISEAGSPTLLVPKNGEYFSVSRFRQVKAELGPFPSTDALQAVEVFLFDTADQPIFYQLVDLAKPRPSSTPPTQRTQDD